MTTTDSVYINHQRLDGEIPRPGGRWKLFLYSLIGAFVFFLPVTYQDKRSIPLDHMVTMVREGIPALVPWIIFALAVYGTVRSFTTGSYKASALQAVFAVLNIVGAVVSFLMVIDALPWVLGDEDLVPFLWNSIAIPVGLIVPIGGAFLAFLIGFGLLEFVGVLMQPIMQPVWKTPGRLSLIHI